MTWFLTLLCVMTNTDWCMAFIAYTSMFIVDAQ